MIFCSETTLKAKENHRFQLFGFHFRVLSRTES
jgi:hypothetical protein